jgi:hypothetical protein
MSKSLLTKLGIAFGGVAIGAATTLYAILPSQKNSGEEVVIPQLTERVSEKIEKNVIGPLETENSNNSSMNNSLSPKSKKTETNIIGPLETENPNNSLVNNILSPKSKEVKETQESPLINWTLTEEEVKKNLFIEGKEKIAISLGNLETGKRRFLTQKEFQEIDTGKKEFEKADVGIVYKPESGELAVRSIFYFGESFKILSSRVNFKSTFSIPEEVFNIQIREEKYFYKERKNIFLKGRENYFILDLNPPYEIMAKKLKTSSEFSSEEPVREERIIPYGKVIKWKLTEDILKDNHFFVEFEDKKIQTSIFMGDFATGQTRFILERGKTYSGKNLESQLEELGEKADFILTYTNFPPELLKDQKNTFWMNIDPQIRIKKHPSLHFFDTTTRVIDGKFSYDDEALSLVEGGDFLIKKDKEHYFLEIHNALPKEEKEKYLEKSMRNKEKFVLPITIRYKRLLPEKE